MLIKHRNKLVFQQKCRARSIIEKKMIKTADIIIIEKLFVGTKQAVCGSTRLVEMVAQRRDHRLVIDAYLRI